MNSVANERVPAWKKLGLKLKNQDQNEPQKRRFDEISKDEGVRDSLSSNTKKLKSVSFTDDSKKLDGTVTERMVKSYLTENTGENGFTKKEASKFKTNTQSNKKNQRSKKLSKPTGESSEDSSQPLCIQYLQAFHTDKKNWKFNKNTQTYILRHLFDMTILPPSVEEPIQGYIEGLQGTAARKRVFESAQEVLDKLSEDAQFQDTLKEKNYTEQESEAALKRHLFNEKMHLLEEEDVKDSKTRDFHIKRTMMQRAKYIVRWMNGINASEVMDTTQVNENNSSQANRLLSSYHPSSEKAAEGPVRKRVRLRKVRTGNPDDDVSSVSSISSDDTEVKSGSNKSEDSESSTESDSSESSASSDESESSTDSSARSSSSTDSDDDDDDDSTGSGSSDSSSTGSESESDTGHQPM
jgi:hypothetical protein